MAMPNPVYPSDNPSQEERERLTSAAQEIGSTAGKTVGAIRTLPERMQELKRRLTVVPGRARQQTVDTAQQLRDRVERQAQELRNQAQRFAHEKPFHLILASAVLGLVVGIALRIWRDRE